MIASVHAYSVKYLGVRLDKKLTWGPHVAEVRLKAISVLNLLRRTLHRCNAKAKIRAYQALVRQRLEYCAPVWKPHKSCDIAALEKVQARAARWICGSRGATGGQNLVGCVRLS